MDTTGLLKYAVEYGASDLHLTVGRPPMVRIAGRLVPSGYEEVLTGDETKALIDSLLTEEQKEKYEEEHGLDFFYAIPDVSRFRVNVFRQQGQVAGVFRTIGEDIFTMEDIGLPESVYEILVRRACQYVALFNMLNDFCVSPGNSFTSGG